MGNYVLVTHASAWKPHIQEYSDPTGIIIV